MQNTIQDNEIMVSVICTVYNHEKYIKECLDGFVMQKTSFPFEVIVHDDASTDRSADIIREYEKKYPWLIKPIYQTENQYSKGISVSSLLDSKLRGKYVALCEGDDYWSDPNKLELQVSELESHPDCYMSVHGVQLIEEDGSLMESTMPSVLGENRVIPTREFLMDIAMDYCYQTVSYLVTANEYHAYWKEYPEFKRVSRTGDYPLMLYFAQLGNISYLSNVLARHRMNGVSSWTKNFIAKKENIDLHWEREVEMFRAYDRYTNNKYSDICQIAINRVTYEKLIRKKEYKALLRPEYRVFLNKHNKKMIINVWLHACVPHLADYFIRMYKKVKRIVFK